MSAGASPITDTKGNALKDALAKLEKVATPQQYSLSKADNARRDNRRPSLLASEKSHAAKRLQASFDREAGNSSITAESIDCTITPTLHGPTLAQCKAALLTVSSTCM